MLRGRKFAGLFSRLRQQFADVQFFGGYRVVRFVAWARTQNGEPKRVFADADSRVYANLGEQIPLGGKLSLPTSVAPNIQRW